jgi:hypothetical protein
MNRRRDGALLRVVRRSDRSAGTLFFNVASHQAAHGGTSPEYNKLVWRPGRLSC